MTRLGEKIARFFRKIAVENLMAYVVASMAVIFVGDMLLGGYGLSALLGFDRSLILSGQVWRIFTFLFIPNVSSPLWLILSLYIYWSIGSATERAWGSANFTAFYITGALLTVAAGLISGHAVNSCLNLSLFIAFASIYSDATFLLFFIIPIKAKWLAILDMLYLAAIILLAPIDYKLSAAAAIGTYLIFFGGSFFRRISNRIKHRDFIREMRIKKK